MDITDFLEARYAEREAAAKAATPSPWAWAATGDKDSSWAVAFVQDEDESTLSGQIEPGEGIINDGVCEGIDGNLADAEHIALNDPAAVLADIEAKRKILLAYQLSLAEETADQPMPLARPGLEMAVTMLANVFRR